MCCLPPLVALVSLPVRQRETGSRFADWGPVLFDMTNYFDRFLPTRSALFDEEDSGDHITPISDLSFRTGTGSGWRASSRISTFRCEGPHARIRRRARTRLSNADEISLFVGEIHNSDMAWYSVWNLQTDPDDLVRNTVSATIDRAREYAASPRRASRLPFLAATLLGVFTPLMVWLTIGVAAIRLHHYL